MGLYISGNDCFGSSTSIRHFIIISLCLVIVLSTPACIYRPTGFMQKGKKAQEDMVGTVTISTPFFVPIEAAVEGDHRLEFRKLRSEEELASALQKPAFRMDRIDASMLQLALAARLASVQVSLEQTTTNGNNAENTTGISRSETRSFSPPDVPSEPDFTGLGDGVMAEMLKLLNRSEQQFNLPPDVLATLVAANKTYMTNLEEYHNVEGFQFYRGYLPEYIPYKVHFTVTAEPGWYARFYQYDAVVEVKLDCEDAGAEDILILSVTPAETAETLSEFTAALSQAAIALSAEVPLQAIAASGSLSMLKAAAERLQGLRASKTLTVGFPANNRFRVRFQGGRSGNDAGRELQAVSRMLTATVLVKNQREGKDLLPLTVPDTSELMQPLMERLSVQVGKCKTLIEGAKLEGYDEINSTLSFLEDELSWDRQRPSFFGRKVFGLRPLLEDIIDEDIDVLEILIKPKGEANESGSHSEFKLYSEEQQKINRVAGQMGRLKRIRTLINPETKKLFPSQVKKLEQRLDSIDEQQREEETLAIINSDKINEIEKSARGIINAINDELDMLFEEIEIGYAVWIDRNPKDLMTTKLFKGREISFFVDAYFSPSIFDKDGEWNPPRQVCLDRPEERLSGNRNCDERLKDYPSEAAGCWVCESICRKAWIPPWFGNLSKKLCLIDAYGYYSFSLSEFAATMADKLNKSQEVDKAKIKVKEAEAALAKLDKETSPNSKASSSGKAKGGGSKITKSSLPDNGSLKAKAQNALAQARKELTELQVEYNELKRKSYMAWSKALKSGDLSVGVTFDAPPSVIQANQLYDVEVWGRLITKNGVLNNQNCPFKRLGRGSQSAILRLDQVDLGFSMPPTQPKPTDKITLLPMGALVELVLVQRRPKTIVDLAEEDAYYDSVQSSVNEISIKPRVGALTREEKKKASTKPKPKDKKTEAKKPAILLDMNKLSIGIDAGTNQDKSTNQKEEGKQEKSDG